MNKYIILEDGKDAVVLYPADRNGRTYKRMLTFHADAWDDTVSAAEDFVEQRIKLNKERSEAFWKSVEIVKIREGE